MTLFLKYCDNLIKLCFFLPMLTFSFHFFFFQKLWLYSPNLPFCCRGFYCGWKEIYRCSVFKDKNIRFHQRRGMRSRFDNNIFFISLLILILFISWCDFSPMTTSSILFHFVRTARNMWFKRNIQEWKFWVWITIFILFIPKSLTQVYLNLSIFVQTDFHSAFNDVKSPWRCHRETLPFEEC